MQLSNYMAIWKNEIKQSIVYLFIFLFISVHEKLNQFK